MSDVRVYVKGVHFKSLRHIVVELGIKGKLRFDTHLEPARFGGYEPVIEINPQDMRTLENQAHRWAQWLKPLVRCGLLSVVQENAIDEHRKET